MTEAALTDRRESAGSVSKSTVTPTEYTRVDEITLAQSTFASRTSFTPASASVGDLCRRKEISKESDGQPLGLETGSCYDLVASL